MGRIGNLRIEVENPLEGTIAKFFLTLPLPSLTRCTVSFGGVRNVRLELDGTFYPYPFSHQAPKLQTLDFTNCYIPPELLRLPSLLNLSIQYYGAPEEQTSALSLEEFQVASPRFAHLRHLVIWNCFSQIGFLDGAEEDSIILPSLESLDVAVPLAVCEHLSRCLVYPIECTVTLDVILPATVTPSDAAIAARAGSSFVPKDIKFDVCKLVLSARDSPGIRLMRQNRRFIYLRFLMSGVKFSISTSDSFLIRAVNLLSFLFPPLDPFDAFNFRLWDSLAFVLRHHLSTVSQLGATFGHEDHITSVTPMHALALFPQLHTVESISFHPPTVYANRPFFHATFNTFPNLRRIVVKLSGNMDGRSLHQAKAAVGQFLNDRAGDNREVQTAVFVIHPDLARRYGFIPDVNGFETMMQVYASSFPPSTDLVYLRE
ncbi:hypothetical protein NMY22_g12486 [Coprinellus aureogranulatus]|nr:hypothetical protein NMY22_g12486 [Coprinellus aureogranulatus]